MPDVTTTGSVLGITDFGPVGGTPLIPPSYLTLYFVIFLLALVGSYIYFSRKRKPLLLRSRLKLLAALTIAINIVGFGGGTLLAAYWLLPSPGIRRTIPKDTSSDFSPINKIEIVFDRPIDRYELEKSISPDTPGRWVFENSLYTTHLYRRLVFYPHYSLRPDTTYVIKLSKIKNMINISRPYDYEFNFKTQGSPNVSAITPNNEVKEVDINSEITVTLDKPNSNISEFYFRFDPQVAYESNLDSTRKIYTLKPKNQLNPGTKYNLKIHKSDVILNLEDASVVERGELKEISNSSFSTKETQGTIAVKQKIGVVKVSSISPENGWTGVNTKSPIKITFNQEVDHKSAQSKFSMSNDVKGIFSWEENTMIFTPSKTLSTSTSYSVSIYKGVKSVHGLDSDEDFQSSFTTQEGTTKLSAPAYLQKYSLSCEAASLRIALNAKGANITEDDLIPKIGFDNTPHNGNIWGNPYNAFVGNIRGRQMVDGYGVYWGPIAKAARNYREAQEFEGWSIEQLTKEILNGNPVVIWVYSHYGTPTTWNTPDGTHIYAVRDEHAVTVVGFVGSPANPSQMIINDPLSGQVYWSRSSFDRKWNIFGRSGVVVR
jgi:Uncharacterized protein conserved in bacteria